MFPPQVGVPASNDNNQNNDDEQSTLFGSVLLGFLCDLKAHLHEAPLEIVILKLVELTL